MFKSYTTFPLFFWPNWFSRELCSARLELHEKCDHGKVRCIVTRFKLNWSATVPRRNYQGHEGSYGKPFVAAELLFYWWNSAGLSVVKPAWLIFWDSTCQERKEREERIVELIMANACRCSIAELTIKRVEKWPFDFETEFVISLSWIKNTQRYKNIFNHCRTTI